MPPYTVHGFKPASGEIAAPTVGDASQNQAYNPAMPPYTVHGFKPASGEIAAPTVGDAPQNQAYNPAMPPYTVHGFKPKSGEIAAPTMEAPPAPAPMHVPKPVQQQRQQPAPAPKPVRQQRQQPAPAPKPDRSAKKALLTQRLLGNIGESKSRKGEEQAPRKKSFSEKFLSRNGRKDTSSDSEIVKGGTAAQRKFVDASEYDEWTCPGCGKVNQEYVGVCACGERKPRVKW